MVNPTELQKELMDLATTGDKQDLEKKLDGLEVDQIISCLKQCILQGKSDPIPLLKSILKGSEGQSESCYSRCTEVYTNLINLLQKNEINSKVAFSIVAVLLAEVDNLQAQSLVDLAHYFVDMVKKGTFTGGKALDLLPKILSIIDQFEEVPKGDASMKGQDFKGAIVNSLCSCKWTPSMTLVMATLFHDVTLTADQLRFVMEKVVRMLKDIELSDQPAIVFQMLCLSSKGHKKLVVEGITSHFTTQDDANRGRSVMIDSEDLMTDAVCLTTLRQVEGTVILHILQAVKQDQDMGREIIKYFKNLQNLDAHKVVSPFNLSLLLSLSRLHHFEDQIVDFVKMTVLRCLKEEVRRKQSFWVRECFPNGVTAKELVLETVDNSSYDWDHVIHGLLQLGFGLMDSYGPKLVFGQLTETPSLDESHMTPNQLACKLGRSLLLKIFKVHEVIRSEILDQTFKNIITKSTAPVSHYLDFLSDIVHSAPQLLLESSAKIQEVLIEISQLPPLTGQGLLMAIQPLLKLSPLLKDSLLLVLRKAMFSRQVSSRKIGALGFLVILKNFRVVGGLPSSQVSQPFALSQIRVEVHGRYNAASNEALCLEILGNLRRCFSQQADIRLAIYQELYGVLHRNSELKIPVLDMLLSQLKKYYDQSADEECPPLRFEACILEQSGQVFLAEPLSHLLGCTQQCVRKAAAIAIQSRRNGDDDEDDDMAESSEQSLEQLQTILADLTKRMIDTSMEAFELDKSADFNLGTSVGVKNNIFAILLMGIYEVLIEFTFESNGLSETSCKQVTELYSNYSKITSLLKSKASGLPGKKGKPASSKAPMSLLSVNTVVGLLRIFVEENDSSAADSKSIEILSDCKDLFSHLVTVACQKLEQIHVKGYADGEQRNEDKVLKDCWILGRLFYLHYGCNQVGSDNLGERDKNVISQCLLGLSVVIKIAILKGGQAMFWCLSHLEKELKEEKEFVSSAQITAKVHEHIKKMQRLASTIIEEDRQNQNWKEFSTLLTMIGQLSTFLSVSCEEFQQTYNWLLKVCTDCSVEDSSASKTLLSLLLTHAKETKSLPQMLRNLCQDIHSQFGDIEKDCNVEDKTHYATTKSNCCPPSSTLLLVLNHFDSDLDDVEWVVKRHQAELLALSTKSVDDDGMSATQQEQMDRTLCTRLGILTTGFIELCHSAIASKPCSHALLKSLTKLFNTLAALTKHYLSLYTNKAGNLCSRFEKLISLVGRQLTQPTYCMITYVQMLEMEDLAHVPEKSKKGKKKTANTGAAQSGMAKAMKQMKSISSLVFAIEQLEKYLIQLSKKSKVNLMENFKHSTSRDFRINAEKVNEVVEDGVSSDDGDSDNDDVGGGDDDDDDGNVADDDDDKAGDSVTVSDESEEENQRPDDAEDAEEVQTADCEGKSAEPPVKKVKHSSKKKKKSC